jgi:hypothetical protein
VQFVDVFEIVATDADDFADRQVQWSAFPILVLVRHGTSPIFCGDPAIVG